MSDILAFDAGERAARFPHEPFGLTHKLTGHSLFTLAALTELARTLPRDRVEYNAGDIDPGIAPENIPTLDMPAEDVIRRIETQNAWMVLKRVESNAAYRAVLEDALNGVARKLGHANAKAAGFTDIQGFVFVSSANATTPFHFDPEENFFVQIHGPKFFHIFDNRDRSILSDEALEMSPSKHRNQPYDPAFEARGEVFSLQPGEGLFVPHLWPHWVRTGGDYSISMAITWKSRHVARMNTLLAANAMLRGLGLPQARPGARPALDTVKITGYRAARMMLEPLRRSEQMRRVLRGLIFGRKANYYYGAKNA
jgi:hypothetical protein